MPSKVQVFQGLQTLLTHKILADHFGLVYLEKQMGIQQTFTFQKGDPFLTYRTLHNIHLLCHNVKTHKVWMMGQTAIPHQEATSHNLLGRLAHYSPVRIILLSQDKLAREVVVLMEMFFKRCPSSQIIRLNSTFWIWSKERRSIS